MRKANAVSSAVLGVFLAAAGALQAQEKVWNALSPLGTARSNLGLTTLADGRLLAVGGASSTGATGSSCEIYDPLGRTWTATASTVTSFDWPELVLLALI